MARANYGLDSIRQGVVKSANSTRYDIDILYTGTGDTEEMIFGEGGVEIRYESPNEKSKNTHILTSQCTIDFLVQNDDDKNFIASLSSTYEEKDVWITVRSKTDEILTWCGYMILDLKDEQDVSYPYSVSLTAIDGMAGLKQIPYIRETNIDTGAIPTFPYVPGDTFYSSSFNQVIGSGTTHSWLADLVYKTGMVLAADDTGGTSYLENYKIQTAVNYYNEDHPAPAADKDPLAYSRIKLNNMHKMDSDGYVTPPTCYTVLEYICKSFGMRCIYWQHQFHFISIDEYNTDEDAAGTPAAPINIPTRVYLYTGVADTNQNYLGNNNLSLYDMQIENGTAPGEGLQKLAGTVYSGLPAIKKIQSTYLSSAGENVYNGFPNLRSTFTKDGTLRQYDTYMRDAATNRMRMQLTDAAEANGIRIQIYLSFSNTASDPLRFHTSFALYACPHGETFGGANGKVLQRNITDGDYDWNATTTGATGNHPYFKSSTGMKKYCRQNCWAPPAAVADQNVGILAYDSALDPYSNSIGCIPIHAAMTGEWDFQFMCYIAEDSDGSSFNDPDWKISGPSVYGGQACHGSITDFTVGGTNYDSSVTEVRQYPDDYQIQYLKTLNGTGNTLTPFMGTFRLDGINVGTPLEMMLEVQNNNSYEMESGPYFWGDGRTMQVSSDGTNWAFADVDGKWVKPTYVWNSGTSSFDYTVGTYNNKLVELVMYNIQYNQSVNLRQFNGTTALAKKNKVYSGTTILKFFNPIAKLTDADNKQYALMRGTWNLAMDEWSITSNEVFYEVPSETIVFGEQGLDGEIQMT